MPGTFDYVWGTEKLTEALARATLLQTPKATTHWASSFSRGGARMSRARAVPTSLLNVMGSCWPSWLWCLQQMPHGHQATTLGDSLFFPFKGVKSRFSHLLLTLSNVLKKGIFPSSLPSCAPEMDTWHIVQKWQLIHPSSHCNWSRDIDCPQLSQSNISHPTWYKITGSRRVFLFLVPVTAIKIEPGTVHFCV